MAKSFFERLTGSVRVQDREEAVDEKPETSKKLLKTRGRSKKEKIQTKESSQVYPDDGEAEVPVTREKTIERRFFASREEVAPHEEVYASTKVDEEVLEEDAETEGELTLDVFDEGNSFVVQAMIAGVRLEDIDISFHEGTLVIQGTRKRQHQVQEHNYYAKELYWGRFSRSVVLPEEVDMEKVEATLKNGVLTLKIPKKSSGGPKKIKIKID